MFSETNEYALRIIAYLAGNAGATVKNVDISKATQVPAGYLYKVLQTLNRAGLVASQRGKHGGYKLNRPGKNLRLRHHPGRRPAPPIRSCPLHFKSHGVNLCPCHSTSNQAFAAVEEAFRTSTIAELLDEASDSVPLCEGPRQKKPLAAAVPTFAARPGDLRRHCGSSGDLSG